MGEPLALVIQQNVRVLKEAEYMKDEFIGLAAHELRTPVAALKGAIGTLLIQSRQGRGASLAEWQEEMLREIDMATDRLTILTDELLDVTRLQAGQLLLHPEPTDLVALTRRVAERLQRTAPHHQLVVNVWQSDEHNRRKPKGHRDVTPDSGVAARPAASADGIVIAVVDTTRIEQALTNLITNAIKYSPSGGSIDITITLYNSRRPQRRHITRSDYSRGQRVEIEVRDEGIGIPADQSDRIFGRFMRADNARRAGIGGTGLGLYITRGLVE